MYFFKSDVPFANIISKFLACIFIICIFIILTINIFWKAEVLSLDEIQFIYFSFKNPILGVVSKNSLPKSKSQRYFSLYFFPRNFIVLGLTFKFCDQFWINFYTWQEVQIEVPFFGIWISIIPVPFVENTIIFPINCFLVFVRNQLPVYVWIYL